ncbi:hypothetical protein CHLRE_02g077650v5 [Chlamydomonas reinhardtii]|uniref:Tyrosine specific protein phosphatases domain-containing protein n=1 Tax=Chlamydomonas reinhardtii TaxID=3055 RepID=A8IAA3_CHLRE|nr:uncharacterized protein CHLRE_02g077650v5 [Chlamydomonas reinhardtii]PNW86218.1 hypothetical protein CHLRE_02g077650v5 [Chlamydomonas reinhardtii]|eukprot:XP_001701652.1 predicted protein [Chlamydomonas reinhardtii]
MSCKADAKYNFGRASEHDEIVYGAARPGAASQRCFNPDDKVTVPEVEEWAAFMSGHGIARVISLLSESEVGTYVQPPTDTLATLFKRAVLVDAKAPGAVDTLVSELKGAVDTGEKVVVHCWGGGGRTGVALAAWLVRHHGLTPAAAAEQVESYAKAQGASRRADVSQLQGFLGASA